MGALPTAGARSRTASALAHVRPGAFAWVPDDAAGLFV
jgi:hypothetical protein